MEYEIKGWEGYYLYISPDEIKVFSSWGLSSIKPKKGEARPSTIKKNLRKELTQRITRQGYIMLDLSVSEIGRKNLFLHRIIAETLIPNPNNLECVDHIDGNKLNNHPSNLQWITRGDNVRKAQSMGKWGTPPKTYKIVFENNKEIIITNISKFSRENNYQASKLVAVSKGKRKKHKDVKSVIELHSSI